jgi:hypothetical protein
MNDYLMAVIMLSPVVIVAAYLTYKIIKGYRDIERKYNEDDDFNESIF